MAQKDNLDVKFADGFVPPLGAGEYTVKAKQALKFETFEASKTYYVSGPRFTLTPEEIYSAYPPEGQSGAFHSTLPHLVFTRRTLPWERAIGLDETDEPIRRPWMALLTVDDNEMSDGTTLSLRTVSLRDLREKRTFSEEPGEKGEDLCLVAEMSTARFRAIAPALDELRFLAHARQVGTDEKDMADMVADGWFAVVIGNRLPRNGMRNHALLVSLEGLGGILKQKRSDPDALLGSDRVHLPVLKHWQYVCEGLTFRDRLEALTAGGPGVAADVWLRVPHAGQGQPTSETVGKALKLGYTALRHRTRQGPQTVSWYRGPLVPQRLDVGPFPLIYANADEALHFDENTGLFDASYAAAWQLGRLLALQKGDLGTSLLHRRAGLVGEAVLERTRELLEAQGAGAIDDQKAKLLLQNDLLVAVLSEWWQSEIASDQS